MRRFTRLTNAFSKKWESRGGDRAGLHVLQLRPSVSVAPRDASEGGRCLIARLEHRRDRGSDRLIPKAPNRLAADLKFDSLPFLGFKCSSHRQLTNEVVSKEEVLIVGMLISQRDPVGRACEDPVRSYRLG